MAATKGKRRPAPTIRAAVDTELRKLKATTSVEGRQAQKMASLIDEASPRDAAAVSRELGILMARIREAARAKDTENPLARIRAERADRRRAAVVQLETERDRRRGPA